jgi:hypothetical protein
VGFVDVQQLRRFVVSLEFLQSFDHYDLNWSAGLRVKGAMTLIRDKFIDGDAPEKHPLSIDNIDFHAAVKDKRKYGSKEQAQRDKRMAHLLILVVDTPGSGGEPVSDRQAEEIGRATPRDDIREVAVGWMAALHDGEGSHWTGGFIAN